MRRNAEHFLRKWLKDVKRKPLVIRGARQVGKSTLVRNFTQARGLRLIEINLEKTPQLAASFRTRNIQKILSDLALLAETELNAKTDLIFLDEIQAIPEAYSALRYFYEDSPQYRVIAAGSLLEVVLAEQEFSMPVGRVQFLSLGPMTFFEFLAANEEVQALESLGSFRINDKETMSEFSEVLHERMIELYNNYLWVGGMPEAVAEYVRAAKSGLGKSFSKISEIKSNLLETYRSDFGKYRRRYPQDRMERIFDYASRNVGIKVKYSNLSREDIARDLKPGIELLERARVLKRVFHTAATTLPLAATQDETLFKFLFLDVGLMMASLGLSPNDLKHRERLNPALLGQITEQFVGQQLLASLPETQSGLFYWIREGKSGNAEVDYVIQNGSEIVPLECKAGARGSNKSLTQFMLKRRDARAIRLDLNRPSRQQVKTTTADHQAAEFELISLPLYLAERIFELVTT
ncbi:AAA family ATPase [Bdellovibrionota bacterium FG-2]